MSRLTVETLLVGSVAGEEEEAAEGAASSSEEAPSQAGVDVDVVQVEIN
jgi:hypothetical protein